MSWLEPVNRSGGFCDLFVVNLPRVGRIAIKRPRVSTLNNDQELIKVGLSTESLKRSYMLIQQLTREATIWQGLEHDYVLRFLGVLDAGDCICLVSPYLSNGSLWEFIQTHEDADRVRLVSSSTTLFANLRPMPPSEAT